MAVQAADHGALLDEVRARFAAEADAARAAHGEDYYPTAMRITGVRTPVLRRVAADLARSIEAPDDVVRLADDLVASGGFEERALAYLLLFRHRAAFATLRVDGIEALGRGMDNWASVDAFATLVAGPAWLAGQLGDEDLERWARSSDRWWRRAALAATVPLNKKRAGDGTGDAPRTLAICDQLAEDHDDMVVKALSWALRSLAERDPAAVSAFLDEQGDALAARVRREARHKLETGLKQPRRGR